MKILASLSFLAGLVLASAAALGGSFYCGQHIITEGSSWNDPSATPFQLAGPATYPSSYPNRGTRQSPPRKCISLRRSPYHKQSRDKIGATPALRNTLFHPASGVKT